MARYGRTNYAKLAKSGFLLGLTLFVVGAGAEFIGHTYFKPVPGWEDTLFVGMEMIGILTGLISPFLFGIFLPLTD